MMHGQKVKGITLFHVDRRTDIQRDRRTEVRADGQKDRRNLESRNEIFRRFANAPVDLR